MSENDISKSRFIKGVAVLERMDDASTTSIPTGSFGVRMPIVTIELLEQVAAEEGVPKSSIVRRAIIQYLNSRAEEEPDGEEN